MAGARCRTLYPFSGERHSQGLRFAAGELLTLLQVPDGGWWEGEKDDGLRGWFPASYVQLLEHTASQPVVGPPPRCGQRSARLEVGISAAAHIWKLCGSGFSAVAAACRTPGKYRIVSFKELRLSFDYFLVNAIYVFFLVKEIGFRVPPHLSVPSTFVCVQHHCRRLAGLRPMILLPQLPECLEFQSSSFCRPLHCGWQQLVYLTSVPLDSELLRTGCVLDPEDAAEVGVKFTQHRIHCSERHG
ncbi:hypothetical protein STEG23_013214 [Scotinomys teguina]